MDDLFTCLYIAIPFAMFHLGVYGVSKFEAITSLSLARLLNAHALARTQTYKCVPLSENTRGSVRGNAGHADKQVRAAILKY